ncbi:MAG: DUF1700 domain-containing protein [Lachnospiraceae bacterium]|nr:DUF1700 domain-containing protein [Lachnospiraceae bacterium]
MNKKAFMEELKRRLKHLPKDDREDAITYYEEYLADMDLEDTEDVTAKLGSPKEIAREIIANCTEKRIDNQKEKGGVKNSATMIWTVILGICAAPFAIPLIGAMLIVLFALLLVVISFVFAIGLAGICFVIVGVCSAMATIFATGLGQKLVCLGMGLTGIAIGVLLLIATIKLAEWMTRGVAKLFRKLIVRKKVA